MSDRSPVLAIALLAAALAWASAVWVGPVLTSVSPRVAAMVYAAGSLVCHQKPDRSFRMAGIRLPVCARCTALYSGAVLGMLAWLLVRGRTRVMDPTVALVWTTAASVPTGVSVVTAIVGIWDPANLPRAALSLPLGLAVGVLTAAVAARDLR